MAPQDDVVARKPAAVLGLRDAGLQVPDLMVDPFKIGQRQRPAARAAHRLAGGEDGTAGLTVEVEVRLELGEVWHGGRIARKSGASCDPSQFRTRHNFFEIISKKLLTPLAP